jgi:hypothetical protein
MNKNDIHKKVLANYKHCVTTGGTLLRSDAVLVFLCGKKPDIHNPGGRDQILDYVKRHEKSFRFFIAEKFFEHYKSSTNLNLLDIEDSLAKYSDCIIIILESEGTFTELGAFSLKKELVKNIMLVNSDKFKNNDDSFITLGPIAKINKESDFKPTIYTDYKSILKVTSDIHARLERIKREKIKHYPIKDHLAFQELKPKIKLLFISDIISIFQPITYGEIINVLTDLYGNNKYDINFEISFLQSIDLIKNIQKKYYISTMSEKSLFFMYAGINIIKYRSNLLNLYCKYDNERINAFTYR